MRKRPYHRVRFAAAFWPALLGVALWAAIYYGLRPDEQTGYTRYLTNNIIGACIQRNPFTGAPMHDPMELEAYFRFIEGRISEPEFFALALALNANRKTLMCVYEAVVRDT